MSHVVKRAIHLSVDSRIEQIADVSASAPVDVPRCKTARLAGAEGECRIALCGICVG
jgi:hypothetical protein